MKESKHKVLFDLSSILSGKFPYSGIPQETRMLFKAFAEADGIQPTGLICSTHRDSALQNFKIHHNPIQQALAYADYFFKLDSLFETKNPLKKLKQLIKILPSLFKNAYEILPFDQKYGDLIWRK